MPVQNPKPQLPALTAIRFFLALWVVVFHETVAGGSLEPSLASVPGAVFNLLRTGYIAVGAFFVLSGFVLAYSNSLDTPWPLMKSARFGIGRFARIYPAYFLGLLLTAPFVVQELYRRASGGGLAKAAAVAGLNGTLLQAWNPKTALTWNAPGWSLSNEAFFYCVFPLAGVALWKIARPSALAFSGLVLWVAALTVPLVALGVLRDLSMIPATSAPPDDFWPNFIKFNPLLNLPAFCIGIVTGKLFQVLGSLKGRGYWLYLPAIASELLVLSFAHKIPYFVFHNGLLLPLHAMTILGLALGGGPLTRILAWEPLVFLGNASYSMYILHGPVHRWLVEYAGRTSWTLSGPSVTLFYVLAVVLVASFAFKTVEEPTHRFLRSRLNALLALRSQKPRVEGVPSVART